MLTLALTLKKRIPKRSSKPSTKMTREATKSPYPQKQVEAPSSDKPKQPLQCRGCFLFNFKGAMRNRKGLEMVVFVGQFTPCDANIMQNFAL